MQTLNEFPTTEDFYTTYWGKKPFVIRGGVQPDILNGLIDGNSLAGLSLEEDIKSRIVITTPQDNNETNKWACEHGPFKEDRFSTLGTKNWSLLVQNVEQYHTNTAKLLHEFNFSPRWLLDDIMVSYSTTGGSVGPHTDSYHVFLVQGMGRRKWTIGSAPIQHEECIEGLDLKVLKHNVQGTEIEVSTGDVIYIPPHFAHEGITLDEALTFSVGFLGPQTSELFIEYGHYLEQKEQHNKRYSGQGLNAQSAGFQIAPNAQKTLQDELIDTIQSDSFSIWLAEYFSTPTHDDVENIRIPNQTHSRTDILKRLKDSEELYKPEHLKLTITTSPDGALNLSLYGNIIPTSGAHNELIQWLNQNNQISLQSLKTLGDQDQTMTLITELYNQNILIFDGEAE